MAEAATQPTTAPATNPAADAGRGRGRGRGGGPPEGPTRNAELPVGIPGGEVKSATRRIPQTDPPPLPVNADLKVLGKPTPRIDGKLKVTGAAKYTADINLPGMLFGCLVGSPYPHAKINIPGRLISAVYLAAPVTFSLPS